MQEVPRSTLKVISIALMLSTAAVVTGQDRPATINNASAEVPNPKLFEVSTRFLIVHTDIVSTATPVNVDVVAQTHVAVIASPRIAQIAIDKFRVNELKSLAAIPAVEMAQAISTGVLAIGKPSPDASNTSIIEFRYRSDSEAEAKTVASALRDAYSDFLNTPDLMIDAKLRQATQIQAALIQERNDLRRPGKTDELSRAEQRLLESTIDLQSLQLKARVGKFDILPVDPIPKTTVLDSATRYKWQSKNVVKGLPVSHHFALEGVIDKGQRSTRFSVFKDEGMLFILGDTAVTDMAGAHDVHINIDPEAKTTTYAGLTFSVPCIAEIRMDGTLLVNKEWITAFDAKKNEWESEKCSVNGELVIAFIPKER